MPDFDPRQAALHYAGEAERLGNRDDETLLGATAQALTCGLVYVGDQLGTELLNIAAALTPADAADRMPQASRRVKVVSVTWGSVILELDGQQYQLFAGETLQVPGLRVEQLPYERIVAMLVGALQGIAHGAELLGTAREIARGALAELERFEREGGGYG